MMVLLVGIGDALAPGRVGVEVRIGRILKTLVVEVRARDRARSGSDN